MVVAAERLNQRVDDLTLTGEGQGAEEEAYSYVQEALTLVKEDGAYLCYTFPTTVLFLRFFSF